MPKQAYLSVIAKTLVLASALALLPLAAAQEQELVHAISPPITPLPPEDQTREVKRFSFIVYGDTRGRRDGTAIQYEHSLVIDSMIARIKQLQDSEFPVRFVLQSGDAVVDGTQVSQWNTSFIPLINRLTTEGGVPYFLTPGNHEHTEKEAGRKNYFDAVSALIPSAGSPRRLAGSTTYSFGYGNTFVIALDANVASDAKQFEWVKSQLEGLNRSRYTNVVAFCHQAPFSSGTHGGASVEPATVELRARYMPLFHARHVRAVFSGHEHLFEHWVEHYTDATGKHRLDLIVSGGGGAPLYPYTGEPDLNGYLEANKSLKVELQHLAKPGNQDALSPYHFVIVRVDGDKLEMQVVGVDWGKSFAPYRSNETELQDQSTD
jgi:hypothetical protein